MNSSDSIPLNVATFLHMIAVRLPDWLLELEEENIAVLYICIHKHHFDICSEFLRTNEGATESPKLGTQYNDFQFKY
jgi:hypothetical protein